jgi:hypothetical protein
VKGKEKETGGLGSEVGQALKPDAWHLAPEPSSPTKLEKNQINLFIFTLKFGLIWIFFVICFDFDDLIF